MKQPLKVREVMRPPKGDNITLEAKRAFLEVMREEREEEEKERKKAEQGTRRRAKAGAPAKD